MGARTTPTLKNIKILRGIRDHRSGNAKKFSILYSNLEMINKGKREEEGREFSYNYK